MTASNPFDGIYDLPEAARYLSASWQGLPLLSVSSAKMIGWIRKGVASRDLVDVGGRELLIGFEDLISMRVIAALRAANVSWPATREAENRLLGVALPRPVRSWANKLGQAPGHAVRTGTCRHSD